MSATVSPARRPTAGAEGDGWRGRLHLHYRVDDRGVDDRVEDRVDRRRTVAWDRHEGPLRVLQRLYPEGDAVCHHVLVHPPGGIVGGDQLQIDVTLDERAQALITTPGATRFYRSSGRPALQQARLQLARDARLEWLPLETLAYSGCEASNRVRFELAEGAQMIGWDLLALGLPAAHQPFEQGRFEQCLEWPGRWLERGLLRADDTRLLTSPLGLAGHPVCGTLWAAAGGTPPAGWTDALLDSARLLSSQHALAAWAGATSPSAGLVLLRVLAPRVEPAMDLLRRVWQDWRQRAWQRAAGQPRIWST